MARGPRPITRPTQATTVSILVAASTARSEADSTNKIGSADVTGVAAAASSTMAPAASLMPLLSPTLIQLPAHTDLPIRSTR
jgi:TctA family transporter